MKNIAYLPCLVGACLAFVTGATNASVIESRPVQFAKGSSSATIKSTIKGSQTIDYKLRARSGQNMSVSLQTSNNANFFNVLPPGSNDVAIFIGSNEGNDWTQTLSADGEYTIRVYLMRSAARSNESAQYSLSVRISGRGDGRSTSDAKVKGTPFHATGTTPCSMGSAAPDSARCDFGVIRGGAGKAEVHLTPPGGLTRILHFNQDKVSGGNEAKVKAQQSSDGWIIEVNDYEHYRIPEAIISGG